MQIFEASKLVTVAEMQQIERRAATAGHSYASMMEMAGRAVAQRILAARSAMAKHGPVLVLVGPGNNGGDGLVCARHLHENGVQTRVYLWRRATDPEHDDENHFARLVDLGIPTAHTDDDPAFAQLQSWLREASMVVDALLGTGANRPIAEQLAELLHHVRTAQTEYELPCVAVDCPSGLNCDTGALDPHALFAEQTVTFAYGKWGHYQFPGAEACGQITVADIGIPTSVTTASQTFVLNEQWLTPQLPQRSNNSHKGSFGKVMAVVGCMNYAGAAYLSCAAAGRVGAGLVTGAIPQPVWAPTASKLTEATWLPLPATDTGHFDATAAYPVGEALAGYKALLVGCGLGQTDSTGQFLHQLLGHLGLPPTVIDADGLNCLAQIAQWPTRLPEFTVLTPHMAEMSRLSRLPIADVTAQRWTLAQQKAAEWNVVLLIKGPYTVIAAPSGELAILPVATSALATAGTGDVLAGSIAGLLAQELAPFAAACLGSWIHGMAGLLCAQEIGAIGVVASDLLPRLPLVLRKMYAR
ncbi:MAG: NAD(P)H-hydrate dehydratase [Caldilineaceae bacterium]|nr:NAD(P)H-hydrate dehydratase [Caldilineaceae bacterium]